MTQGVDSFILPTCDILLPPAILDIVDCRQKPSN